MQGMIHVVVRLFGPAADAVGAAQVEYALAAPAVLGNLVDLLMARYPKLAAGAGSLRYAVNEEYAEADAPLADGDEVAVIPPVGGGSGPFEAPSRPEGKNAPMPFSAGERVASPEPPVGGERAGPPAAVGRRGQEPLVEVTTGAISAAAVSARAARPGCGAVVTFEGVVRPEGEADNPLVALEYSAHERMAVRVLGRIRAEALERFGVEQAAVVHRTGRLAVGEVAVVVAVAAGHRGEAFEACRWIIDALKIDVPIWKKEIWSRGESTWVDPTSRPE